MSSVLCCFALSAAEVDRRVAEWTLWMGGQVTLAGTSQPLGSIESLPKSDFVIERLDWVGMNVEPTDLERLSALRGLKALHLPGPMWNRNADSGKDGSDQMSYLAPLASLEVLTFSDHFLDRIRFHDSGLAQLKNAAHLRELAIRQSSVRGHTLGAFTGLEKLDLSLCPVDDAGFSNLAAMQHLKQLWAGDTLITDAGLAALRGLDQLEDLDLHGTGITDSGLSQISNLKKLKRLNLMSTAVTDAGLKTISGFRDLEQLNLYRTSVTNGGLEALRNLRSLASLDLRYTRVTQAGVGQLSAAMPGLHVDSVRGSGRVRPKQEQLARLALPAFIRALGGKITLKNGQIDAISLSQTAVTDDDLRRFAGLATLRSLDLEGTEIGDAGIRQLGPMPSLEDLNLSSTMAGDASIQALSAMKSLRRLLIRNTLAEGSSFAVLSKLPELAELDASGSPVVNDSVEALAGASLKRLLLASTDIADGLRIPLKELRELDLGSTDLTDQGLAALRPLTNLRVLILHDARFTDAGLAHLRDLRNLEHLDLSRTRVSDEGIPNLAGLTNLRRLILDYTEVHDTGLAQLQSLAQLRELSLDSTHASDVSVTTLQKFKSLDSLNLYHTLVTQKAIEVLRTSLPHCRIIWDPNAHLPNRRRS